MFVLIVKLLLLCATLYILCGMLFAFAFISRGLTRVDEGAKGSTIGFRIIIIPATVIFWPLLLKKWIRAAKNKNND